MEREARAKGTAVLVTIGEFARSSRLSAKALRRYDELGLLRPALVDPVNGYRYYDGTQVGTARLVAWLRRIGGAVAADRPRAPARGARLSTGSLRSLSRGRPSPGTTRAG